MKISMNDLLDANQVLQRMEPGPKTAYRFMRISQKVTSALRQFNATRDALFRKYGKMKPDGTWQVDPENIGNLEKFDEHMTALLAEEVEIDLPKLELEDVREDGVHLSATGLGALWFVLDGKKEEE